MEYIIDGYSEWINEQIYEGWSVFYVNIMFLPLKGQQHIRDFQMRGMIEHKFYPELCGQLDRHPNRPGRHQFSPRIILFPDMPVFKYDANRIVDSYLNGGLHYNGFIAVSDRSRLQGNGFIRHFQRREKCYRRYGFERIVAVHCRPGENNVVDYSMKSIKHIKVDYDSAIILPRSYAERFSRPCHLNPVGKSLRDLQAATNLSDETAMQIINSPMGR
jgi:hypothetical protein